MKGEEARAGAEKGGGAVGNGAEWNGWVSWRVPPPPSPSTEIK